MTIIDRRTTEALQAREPFKLSNTAVEIDNDGAARLYLFGNLIAINPVNGPLQIRHLGWTTVTTKARLNAALRARGLSALYMIGARKGQWYLGDTPWPEHAPDAHYVALTATSIDVVDPAQAAKPERPVPTPNTSVSHGTLRLQDLVPTLLDELEHYAPEEYAGYAVAPFGAIPQHAREDEDAEWWMTEAPLLFWELLNTLSAYAPEGCYFGNHEGDGSDFGWWEYPTEEDEA